MSPAELITIELARPQDIDTILSLRDEAAMWVAAKGSDQWRSAWPTPEQQAERLAGSIAAGETWMLYDRQNIAGTVAAS